MKFNKGFLLTILIQLLLVYNPLPVVAQDLEEVVKRYTKSIWGNTELDSIRSLRTFGIVQNENGAPDYYFLQEMKIPSMIKNEYFTVPNGKRYTIAYDGEVGWELEANKDSVSAVRLSQERSKHLSSHITIIEPFIQPERIGAAVMSTGKQNFYGNESLELVVKLRDGTMKGFYIDPKEYRLLGTANITIENSQKKYSNIYHLKDYKKVEGIYFSFLTEQTLSDGKTNTIKILRIEVNPEFSDNHFKMP